MRHQHPSIEAISIELMQPDAKLMIADLLDACPAAAQVFLRHGMACVGCTMAPFETLADAAREYGIDSRSLLVELGISRGGSQHRRKSAARRSRAQSKLKTQGRGEAEP